MILSRATPLKPIAVIIFALALFTGSCGWFSSGQDCRRIIERRKMARLLNDVVLLETRLSNLQGQNEQRDSVAWYYAAVFQKHNVTLDQFEKAFGCYLLDNDDMVWLMDEVLSSLSILHSRVDERKEEEGFE